MASLLSPLPQGEAAFFIGLQRAVAERGIFAQRLWRESGLEPQWWEGVDGLRRMVLHPGEKLSFGYQKDFTHNVKYGKCGYNTCLIGCYLAHYRLWKHCLEKGYRRVLIMEDDAIPHPNLHKVWDELLSLDDSFEVIKLFSYYAPSYCNNEKKQSAYALWHFSGSKIGLHRPFDFSYATTAYLATRGALQKLVARAMPVTMPVDYYLDSFEIHGARVFVTVPGIVLSASRKSSVYEVGKPRKTLLIEHIFHRMKSVTYIIRVIRRTIIVLLSSRGSFYPNKKIPPHLFWRFSLRSQIKKRFWGRRRAR